jgi:acyl-[acyl-carrier-protein]-phospholipid O-acyltransferase/long-chain-fatty-acid--[acyl-carrier-protein] ligase
MPRPYNSRAGQRGVFDALVDASQVHGAGKPILEDQERNPLTYTDLIRAAFALGRRIAAITEKGERVGIMLPSSAGGVVTFLALTAYGRVPTMLNFTAGIRNLKAACKLAGVKRVLTAQRFIDQGKLDDLIDALQIDCQITYLEEVRKEISLADKAFAALAGVFPKRFRTPALPSDPGVILFTSGSFGAPRGVVLTQGNLCANADQVAAHIDLSPDWVFFNPLPIFHCFGLTGGVLLPLLNGLKSFQYPSPLHVKQIPTLIRESQAAVLLATDTFVNQYARASDPGDLTGLKYVVCGAERVRDETQTLFNERYPNVELLEGYGATEAAPVIAVNGPGKNRRGTVGQVVPGMEVRLEPVEGISTGQRLMVAGPNIMAGYINENGQIEPPEGGWHDTGDVVTLDDEGYVAIKGRVKRFAKIGGEMVSLAAAEDLASGVWPDARHAVISMPDKKKGERLVLVTDRLDASVSHLVSHAQSVGAPELAIPRKIVMVPEIPLLGSGKTDYVAIQRMAETDLRAA